MAYLTPGVYVEEKSSGEKPIAGVGTGTGGFVGIAEKGPIGEAKLITSLTDYKTIFGGYVDGWYMPYAVEQFFKEGGSKCYVIRTVAYGGNLSVKVPATAVPAFVTLQAAGVNVLTVTASSPGTWANGYTVDVTDVANAPSQFNLILKDLDGNTLETHANLDVSDLTNKPLSSQLKSNYITFNHLTTARPDVIAGAVLASGNEVLTGITVGDFLGDPVGKNGLVAFDEVDEVNMIAMPDIHFIDTAGETDTVDGIIGGVTYCENRKDCFFIGDIPSGKTPTEAATFKLSTLMVSSSYGAIYYPWIKASFGGTRIDVPPSGAVMGVISRTDADRGVFKAPAGVIDGKLRTAVGIEYPTSHGEQEELNPIGVNVIRNFAGAGNVIWGARTFAAGVDAEWHYINVRRYFMYVEETLDEGTQWVVFEPNTPALWGNVKRNITAFLTNEWRAGALFGNTAEEAFYVKVDAENNPPSVRNLGQLIIEIGIAPVKPAEFVIIRISQKTQTA